MENYDDFDFNDVHSNDGDTSDVDLNDVKDDSYLVSSGYQSSDDSDDADNIHNDDLVEVDVIVGDRLMSINYIISNEIHAMEFGNVNEANVFYYRYGKCKDFAIRKSDVRTKGPKDRAQINVLPSHEIRTCHIMGYMIVQKGRYVGVGFTKKDMYNYFDKKNV
ncbi:hypothetical protein KIW84_035068 [Lathyrus oleraceus]|uniref:Uncharacterized protein n=1 Tax=Pisum sativum TaxID=3888 RepID=A0A9D4Y0B0_PEA|nr:hypothetical protein KIW84_035068 [Pisum sativum]